MADIHAEAARAARAAGVPPNLFIALITRGERSFRGWQRSPAGAAGPAQLMPGTAAGLARKYGINPNTRYGNLLGGAYYLREQLENFKDPRLAVAAYNAGPGAVQKYGGVPPYAETQRYVQNIMRAVGRVSVPKASAPRQQPRVGPPTMTGPLSAPPAFSPTGMPDLTSAITSSLGQIAMGVPATETLGGVVEAATAPQTPPAVAAALGLPASEPRDPRGHRVAKAQRMPDPGGGWGGSYRPATALAQVGFGFGLTSTSEKRDRKTTATGGTSDHWVGSKTSYAYDLGGSVAAMDRAAAALAARLGIKYRQGQPLVATVTRGGMRYQLLYRTNVGGNHFTHIHVGVRRSG